MAMKVFLKATALFTGAYAPYPGTELPAHLMQAVGTSFLETESQLGVAATAQRLSTSVSQLEAALRNHHAVQVKQAKALKKHRQTARSYAKTAMKMLQAAKAQMRSVADTEAELRLKKSSHRQANKAKSVFAHAASAPSGAIELRAFPTGPTGPKEDVATDTRSNELEEDEPWHDEEQTEEEKEEQTTGEENEEEEDASQDDPDTTAMLQTCKVASTHSGSAAFEKLKECTQALKSMAQKAQEAHEASTKSNVDYAKKFTAINTLMTELEDVDRMRTHFEADHERVGKHLLNQTMMLAQPINSLVSAAKAA